MSIQTATRLGLLIGSSRNTGNGPGLAKWLAQLLDSRLNAPGASHKVEIVPVDPTEPPRPLGPVVDGSKLPAQIPDASSYASPVVRDWSKFVSSCSGFAILAPEYNGGYPGELKNSLDHLYREWNGKPVVLVTYGGGGGVRCGTQLQAVFGALKMQVVADAVNVKLPPTFTGGSERVPTTGDFPEFLGSYVDAVNGAADKLRDALLANPVEKL